MLAVRRELLERVRLKFKFHATFIEEDDANADARQAYDGVPVVDAVLMTVTNRGRGITIPQCRCEYESSSVMAFEHLLLPLMLESTSDRARRVKAALKSTRNRFGSRLP